MTAPTAGWYPDPTGNGQRYWDGMSWSDVSIAQPKTEGGRLTIHYGFALLALFALGGTIVPALLLFMAAGDSANDPSTFSAGVTMGVLWLIWGGMWTLIWAAFAIHHTLKGRNH